MELKELLLESAEELRNRPSFFAPKLVTSIIGSLWILWTLQSIGNPFTAGANPDINTVMLSLTTFPFIIYFSVLSPVILAEMVKNNSTITEASVKSLKNTPRLIAASILLITLFTASAMPVYIGLFSFIISGSITSLVLGLAATLTAVLFLSYGIYFLPIALTDNSALNSVKNSFKASKNYRKEVTLLLLISFGLLGLASISSGPLQDIGAAGFILGRAASSAIATYTFIVSPKAYMELD